MAQIKCCNCGSTKLVAGGLQSTGTVYFRPRQARFMTFRTADVAVQAMMCCDCGVCTAVGDVAKLRELGETACGAATAACKTH